MRGAVRAVAARGRLFRTRPPALSEENTGDAAGHAAGHASRCLFTAALRANGMWEGSHFGERGLSRPLEPGARSRRGGRAMARPKCFASGMRPRAAPPLDAEAQPAD